MSYFSVIKVLKVSWYVVVIVIITAKNYSLDTLLTAASTDLKYSGKSVHVTMVPNPSHLEV